MKRPFSGFSSQRDRSVSLPIELFTQVLEHVQDLAELKALLTVFRLLAAKDLPREKLRAVSWEELHQDQVLREGLAVLGRERTPAEHLDRALERAVARGTLLHLVAQRGGHAESWYLVNTSANRQLVEQLAQNPAGLAKELDLGEQAQVRVERPNIFTLYEQNIGVITPMLAEELDEAALQYPAAWIEEAFREAVAHNARNWRYVQAILERWSREGRGERPGRQEQPIDIEKYTRGKYAHLFGERQPEEPAQDEETDDTDRA